MTDKNIDRQRGLDVGEARKSDERVNNDMNIQSNPQSVDDQVRTGATRAAVTLGETP